MPKPWPCWYARDKEYTITNTAPNKAQIQNPSRARWCSTQAATAAVASGNKAVMTAAWPEVTWRNAKPKNNG